MVPPLSFPSRVDADFETYEAVTSSCYLEPTANQSAPRDNGRLSDVLVQTDGKPYNASRLRKPGRRQPGLITPLCAGSGLSITLTKRSCS